MLVFLTNRILQTFMVLIAMSLLVFASVYAIGNPIYGDQKYKFSNTDKAINKNLMLHSYQIKFMIKDIKYTYTALVPDYFKKILKTKRLRFPNF